jgi:serine/threonine protein kinase
VLVQEPGCISLFDLKERMHETRFPEGMVKAILTELLQALDFLHTECKAVHTGQTLPHIQMFDGLVYLLTLDRHSFR